MTHVVFVGLATLDLAYLVDTYPREDSKNLARQQFCAGGGPALNAAVTCATLGTKAVLITPLGCHPLADLIRADLERHGVTVVDSTPELADTPPISSIVVVPETGSRTVVSIDGTQTAAQFSPELERHLDGAGAVLIDGHHPELAHGFACAARARGITVVMDAGRWKPHFPELLPLVDVAIVAAEFTAPDGVGLPDLIARTHGSGPIEYPGGEIAVESVDVVDTLGAGDILHGAFCHYYLHHSFPDALRMAAETASLSTRFFGTREWIGRLNSFHPNSFRPNTT